MSEESRDQPEKKIIVDEDWKQQVEREREELRARDSNQESDSSSSGDAANTSGKAASAHEQDASSGGSSSGGSSGQTPTGKEPAAEVGHQSNEANQASVSTDELPPASMEQIISMLASSAMVYLGQMPDPIENKPVVNLPLARHYIDMLDVISEKTNGNLTSDETAMLQTVTYQLRMAFVSASS